MLTTLLSPLFKWLASKGWDAGVKPKRMELITADQLNKVTDTLVQSRCEELAELFNEAANNYGITDKVVFNSFAANLLQESGECSHKEENMYYSKPERIKAVWPSRFATVSDAVPYAKNPQKLSNLVYGNRMGNTEPNDGFTYKGAGFIGITGKELYTKYANYIGKPVAEAAELIRTTDKYSMDSAAWFFAVYKKLIPIAKEGDFKKVCSLINTGSANKTAIGMNVREKYYNRLQSL